MLTLTDVRHRTGSLWAVVEAPVSSWHYLTEDHRMQVAAAVRQARRADRLGIERVWR